LIIVDECHHFRRLDSQGCLALKEVLHTDAAPGTPKPYALLLTATPVSVGLKNLNALLDLIGEGPVGSVDEIEDRHSVVIASMPFILTVYGIKQPGRRGRRAIVRRRGRSSTKCNQKYSASFIAISICAMSRGFFSQNTSVQRDQKR